jgi:hypothetical protein
MEKQRFETKELDLNVSKTIENQVYFTRVNILENKLTL